MMLAAEHLGDQGEHSFVVPAYGHSPHLEQCLESLRAQSSPSQVVLSTSTPFPELQAIASRYDARLLVHGPNAGIGHDWNQALAAARTPWVTLAHQDDVYLPEFTARTMALARATPDAVLVCTDYAELLDDGGTRRNSAMLGIKRLLLELGFLGASSIRTRVAKQRLLRFGCPIPCPSVTLRIDRTALRFREDLKVNLDWDAWLRLAAGEGAFAYSREVSMLHRIHAGSETSAGIRGGVRAQEDRMMFETLWPAPVARLLARAYAYSYGAGAP
jgi:glycosyltransferase involved in cell wall biosynthesis